MYVPTAFGRQMKAINNMNTHTPTCPLSPTLRGHIYPAKGWKDGGAEACMGAAAGGQARGTTEAREGVHARPAEKESSVTRKTADTTVLVP